MTTLAQLAEVRKECSKETKRIYAILYSELLEVRAAVYAGELVRQGAIGKVIQTINIAPHQIFQGGRRRRWGSERPEWFGIRRSSAAFFAISARTRWISSSTTRDQSRQRLWNRRFPMCAIPKHLCFRTSVTWCCAAIAGLARAPGLVRAGRTWNVG